MLLVAQIFEHHPKTMGMEKQNNPLSDRPASQTDPESYEPDTQKIVQRHMQDETHEITDEEIRSVKISTDHIDQEYKKTPGEAAAPEEKEERHTDLDDKIITPWDLTT